jgi:para-aminobenzoate synthetase component 1
LDKSFIFEGSTWGPDFLQQLLKRASEFSSCCFLDNLSYKSELHQHDFLLGAGEVDGLSLHIGDGLNGLDIFLSQNRGRWIFGHIAYDLSKTIHGINSSKTDPIGFPILHFFVPKVCFRQADAGIEMIVQDEEHDLDYWVDFFSRPSTAASDLSHGSVTIQGQGLGPTQSTKGHGESLAQSPGASLTQSSGESLAQSPGACLTQSPGACLSQSSGACLTHQEFPQSPDESLTQSPGASLTQSPGASLTQSPGACLTQSPGACLTHQELPRSPGASLSHPNLAPNAPIHLQPKLSRQAYTGIIDQLRQHILRGDCYEINFCQEFFAEDVFLEPVDVYHLLAAQSPNPFACYYRHHNAHLMCASPERYLTRRGNKLISQPIKGTSLRHPEDPVADAAAALALRNSQKEVSENVMVVDLVRNDLSRICTKGSVQVDELFGIYSYPQVHQMISTISGAVETSVAFSDILKATFPMGSMTGAPKLRVMELIEQYEPSARGLFSGSVGYIAPNGDFDFNVVIRSILYNEERKYLSYQVGSGITWYCKPEEEYEECLWKAGAIRKVLGEG